MRGSRGSVECSAVFFFGGGGKDWECDLLFFFWGGGGGYLCLLQKKHELVVVPSLHIDVWRRVRDFVRKNLFAIISRSTVKVFIRPRWLAGFLPSTVPHLGLVAAVFRHPIFVKGSDVFCVFVCWGWLVPHGFVKNHQLSNEKKSP